MEKVKISASQLFILMVLFELGSALLIPLAMKAKQDAWLAILLGMICSFFLFLVYHKLLGKVIGKTIAFLYILYFANSAARVLRDFGEMLLTFSYPNTPLFIANALLMLVIIYTVRKG